MHIVCCGIEYRIGRNWNPACDARHIQHCLKQLQPIQEDDQAKQLTLAVLDLFALKALELSSESLNPAIGLLTSLVNPNPDRPGVTSNIQSAAIAVISPELYQALDAAKQTDLILVRPSLHRRRLPSTFEINLGIVFVYDT